MKRILFIALLPLALVGCNAGSATTNEDAKSIAADLDASKRGVVAQPETDVLNAPPAGGGAGGGGASEMTKGLKGK